MSEADLYHAVANNDWQLLSSLIESGGNVDTVYYENETQCQMNMTSTSLLHMCCLKGNLECLKSDKKILFVFNS